MLGNKEVAVRIGALHTLRLLAEEDKKYHQAFIDITKGYIKSELGSDRLQNNKTNWQLCIIEWKKEAVGLIRSKKFADAYKEKPYRIFPEDLKIALSALASRKSEELIDFTNTDWVGFDFGETEIKEFKFFDFSKSIFSHTHFCQEQTFSNCRLHQLTFDNSHWSLPHFESPYLDKNRNSIALSFKANELYMDSAYLSHYLSGIHISNSKITFSYFLEDNKFGRFVPLSQSLFINVGIHKCWITRVLSRVVFKNCYIQDVSVSVHDKPNLKNRIRFDNIFLIDTDIVWFQGKEHFFSGLNCAQLPVRNYKEENVDKIYLDKQTFLRNSKFFRDCAFFPLLVDQEFQQYMNPSLEEFKAFLDEMSKRTDLGLIIRKSR